MKKLVLGFCVAIISLNSALALSEKELVAFAESCKNGNIEACKTILPITKNLCDKENDMAFCANLSAIYRTMKDYQNARKYFQKICDGGYSEGCHDLGIIYYNGYGVRVDKSKALAYYKKACDGGNARSCYNLGGMYGLGDGVKQNESKALEYIGRACDMGLNEACYAYNILNLQ